MGTTTNQTRGPNPLRVAWSVWRARRVAAPQPRGTRVVDHDLFQPVLTVLEAGGVAAVASSPEPLERYLDALADTDPDQLSPAGAMAFWLNLYNAGAIQLAARTWTAGEASVLRVPGGFDSPFARVAGEDLSLGQIEHGKIRRFGDPRIHGALVCGSASCPTLRYEPYLAATVGAQLDDQLRSFLRNGGAVADRAGGILRLSRVFLWYGGDFARPQKMPTWLPPTKRWLRDALRPWLGEDVAEWMVSTDPAVQFQSYDWGLSCQVR